jgi:hypothetical protein
MLRFSPTEVDAWTQDSRLSNDATSLFASELLTVGWDIFQVSLGAAVFLRAAPSEDQSYVIEWHSASPPSSQSTQSGRPRDGCVKRVEFSTGLRSFVIKLTATGPTVQRELN